MPRILSWWNHTNQLTSSDQKPYINTKLLQFRSEPFIFSHHKSEILYQQFWLFIMAVFSSIKNAFLHNLKVCNFQFFFRPSFNVQKTDYNLLNKYIIYKVNQYQAMNIKNYSL